jgi:hypothetical protein
MGKEAQADAMSTPEPPTREEWIVIGVSACVALAVSGLIALGFAWLRPPADPADVHVLVRNGACLVGLGVIAALALRWFTR